MKHTCEKMAQLVSTNSFCFQQLSFGMRLALIMAKGTKKGLSKMKTMVVHAYHDDWLAYILLDDGSMYIFNTEVWYQHGRGSCFSRVMPIARAKARKLHTRGIPAFCSIPSWHSMTDEDIQYAVDMATCAMSDKALQFSS